MARVQFHGPEGARWAGRELVIVSRDNAKLRDLSALQLATGWTMKDLQHMTQEQKLEGPSTLAVLFLTLRNAGFMASWDEVGELTFDDFDFVKDVGDDAVVEDPTPSAGSRDLADEPNVDREPAKQRSPRSRTSRGSSSRSATA